MALLGLCGLLACSIDVSASFSFKLAFNTRVLEPTANEQAEVAPTTVTLPATAIVRDGSGTTSAIEPGTVLVSEDFVRKVVTTERAGDKIVATTAEASLADVIEKGETSTVRDLGRDPALRAQWIGVSPRTLSWAGSGFEYKNEVLVGDGQANARLDVTFTFQPVLDLKFGFQPLYAHAIARGRVHARASVVGMATIKPQTYDALLWQSPPFEVRLPPIGGVPIKFRGMLRIRALLTVESSGRVVVQTGFDLDASAAYGFRYTDDRLSSVSEVTLDGNVIPPVVTDLIDDLKVRAALRGEFEGGINGGWWVLSGEGGLRLGAEAYAQLHATPKTWKVEAGLTADASAYLRAQALWWSAEWRAEPRSLGVWPLDSWPETPSIPSATPACLKGSPVQCGAASGCALCTAGASCNAPEDCASGACWGTCVELPGKKAGEACDRDWDCRLGLSCVQETVQGGAINGVCRPLHCSNKRKDADEADYDCGGTECAKCYPGLSCGAQSDCAGTCRGGRCYIR